MLTLILLILDYSSESFPVVPEIYAATVFVDLGLFALVAVLTDLLRER